MQYFDIGLKQEHYHQLLQAESENGCIRSSRQHEIEEERRLHLDGHGNIIFRSRDGLIFRDRWPENIVADARVIYRPVKADLRSQCAFVSDRPTVDGGVQRRPYHRTGEYIFGVPVFEEAA